MNIVFEYEDSISDGTVYYYGLNRTHNSSGEIYVYNAHGDTVQLVKNNAVVVSYTYDAFGNLASQVGESDNPFLYCSEYFDEETQTYYLRARYYNPANGHFTQQDAWAFMDISDSLSLNLYTYCFNNPVRYHDVTGNIPVETALDVVSIGVSAGEFVANPSFVNFGYLVWDIASAFIPYVPGSYSAKGIKLLGKLDDVGDAAKLFSKVDNLSDAAKIFKANSSSIIGSYSDLKKTVKSLGIKDLEVHHLFEKRFADKLGLKANDIISVAIDKDTHKKITKLMREKIGYAWDWSKEWRTTNVTPQKIWDFTVDVYSELDMEKYIPELKEYLLKNSAEAKNINFGKW